MNILRLTSLLLMTFVPVCGAWAKSKPADFSAFAGNYKGTGSLSFSGVGNYPITVSLGVKAPRQGKVATITINGSLFAGGGTYPVFGTLQLKSKTLTTSDLLFNVMGATIPATIASHARPTVVSAAGPFTISSTTGYLQCKIKVAPRGKKKKKLSITYTLGGNGFTYTFQFDATAKGTLTK